MLQTRLTTPDPRTFLAFACRAKEALAVPNVKLAMQRADAEFRVQKYAIQMVAETYGFEQASSYAAGMIVYGRARGRLEPLPEKSAGEWRPTRSMVVDLVVGAYLIFSDCVRPVTSTAHFLSRGVQRHQQGGSSFKYDHVRRAVHAFVAQSLGQSFDFYADSGVSVLDVRCAVLANEVKFMDALWERAKAWAKSADRALDVQAVDKLADSGALFDWQCELEENPPFEPGRARAPSKLIEIYIGELRKLQRAKHLRETLNTEDAGFAARLTAN